MDGPPIYHEKQSQQLCALHTLNNLLQDRQAFTKKDLDHLCVQLSPQNWINPHRSILGLGNYDINIIIAALQTKDCEVQWWDRRKDPSLITLDNIIGIIVNVPSNPQFGVVSFPYKRKHWIAVKEINGQFYNLDSKLSRPAVLGNREELLKFLREKLENKNSEIFVVKPLSRKDIGNLHVRGFCQSLVHVLYLRCC
nr:EOG090X0HOM [Eulimnadia texana]